MHYTQNHVTMHFLQTPTQAPYNTWMCDCNKVLINTSLDHRSLIDLSEHPGIAAQPGWLSNHCDLPDTNHKSSMILTKAKPWRDLSATIFKCQQRSEIINPCSLSKKLISMQVQ